MYIKRGINIIFLDIDGVLNCETTEERCGQYIGIEDQKLELLKQLVNQTKSYIVLTSSWKQFWYHNPAYKNKQDDLAVYLDKALAKYQMRIIAKTNDDFNPFKRGQGILNYLRFIKGNEIRVNNYVIFDDLTFDYRQTNLTQHLVKTDSRYGLQINHIMKAISLLKTKTLK